MKALHVLNHSLPHVDGYSVRSAQVLRVQKEGGFSPMAITSPRQEGVAQQIAFESIEGVPHYRSPPEPRALRGAQLLYRRISEVVRQERPQLIHAHTPSLWALPAAVAAKRHGLPLVYEVRSFWEDAAVDSGKTGPRSARYQLTRALETWVMRQAAVVLPISEGLAGIISQRGIARTKLFVAPNGVHADSFIPQPRDVALRDQLGLPSDALVIGFLGSILVAEGIEDLVKAMPRILERVANAYLVIVGTGPLLENVRATQRRLAHPERVRIVGAVPLTEVKRYYSLFDLVVYPRRSTRNSETVTPLKPLEAMAMEKAVLVSNVGGLRELVDDTVGAGFRVGDIEHLAQQCIALLSDGARRAELGREARRRVIETRSWNRLAEVYRQAYSMACGVR